VAKLWESAFLRKRLRIQQNVDKRISRTNLKDGQSKGWRNKSRLRSNTTKSWPLVGGPGCGGSFRGKNVVMRWGEEMGQQGSGYEN